MTMFYNENVNLPIWTKYYGNDLGVENLFVIDHGSTSDFSDVLRGANVIRLPRSPFDDHGRAIMLSHFQNGLLTVYDYVICTDTDELIIPDPEKYKNIPDYVSKKNPSYATAIGLNLIHLPNREPAIDLKRPILEQRSSVRFVKPMCKTLLSRIPLKWHSGFHSSSEPANYDKDLFLFHIKYMDAGTGVSRLALTRGLEWSNPRIGAHQRISDEQYIKYFENAQKLPIQEDNFDFESDLSAEEPGYQARELHRVPERFKGKF